MIARPRGAIIATMKRLLSTTLLLSLLCPRAAAAAAGDLPAALARVDCGPLRVTAAGVNDGVCEVTLEGDWRFLSGDDDRRERLVNDLFWAAQAASGRELDGIRVHVLTPAGRRLLNDLVHDPAEAELVHKLRALPRGRPRGLPPVDLPFGGSLSGRTIVVSPGHGWIYYDSLRDWSTQRGLINLPGCETCLGIIEDFSNAEIALRYLLPQLLRAGATVWVVRERDFDAAEIITDEDSPGVVERGDWRDGSSPGGHGGDYRVLPAAGGGSITYPLAPPREGRWWISVWYVSGSNRVSDASFTVDLPGGRQVFHLDQRRDGSRWRHLGRFRLGPEDGATLTIAPGPAAEADRYLVADAVRLGGGTDDTVVDGKNAGKPRWQMGALYYLPYLGLPAAANTGSDVTIRPAFAEWQGADAYLSLHSNASGGSSSSASGTSTYRYNCGSLPDHSAAPDPSVCDDPPGSDALQRAVHSSIIEFLRDRWDPHWRDRGPLVANFGEVRVLEDIPGVLVESAFHDGIEKASADMRMPDNQALQDPRFRYWLGYALYAGLSRFFDPQAELLPAEPPAGLAVVHAPDGGLLVSWQAVSGAQGYRVRWSAGGRSLDRELVTGETAAVIAEVEPGDLVAVQVSALNSGGEGPPSELAAARYRGHGTFADVLLVSGFDRQDAYLGDGRNRRDQAWAHALAILAIADRNLYCDFAANEAVEAGLVPLAAYRAVVWICGEESTADETFSAAEQGRVAAYLDGGGALLASGAEIGWDLVEKGDPTDQSFFGAAFGAAYLADDADTNQASGSGAFVELGELAFDDGSAGIYPVEYPDVFSAGGGEEVLAYAGGATAAVAYARNPGRSVIVGFPLETITDAGKRAEFLDLALAWLLPGHTPDDYDSDGLPDDWEFEHDTDPLRPSADDDPDGDGLSNREEFEQGSDPQVPDNGPEGGGDGGPDGGSDGGSPGDADAGSGDVTVTGSGCGCAQGRAGGDAAWLSLLLLLLSAGGWPRALRRKLRSRSRSRRYPPRPGCCPRRRPGTR